ncbi:MAG: transglutaminase domain-containing protein [Bacteroidota bacterium]
MSAYAQEITAIDLRLKEIPQEKTESTLLLASWINDNFSGETDKVTAVYVWLSRNISYDIAGMYNTQYYKTTDEAVKKTLKSRKAVCQGYAMVFTETCKNMNIQAWTISGYTRQNGQIVKLSHAWNSARIEGKWFLFDPCWGAGYVKDGQFYSYFNLDYFKLTPEKMLLTHMPFDPLWQFSEHPIRPSAFDNGKLEHDPNTSLFNFTDTLTAYSALPAIAQTIAKLSRIEQNGLTNEMTGIEAGYLRTEISVFNQNTVINQYNDAVLLFNSGIGLFNKYVNFKNKQFKPKLTDSQIRLMIDTVGITLKKSQAILSALQSNDETLIANINTVKSAVIDSIKRFEEESAFVTKYLKTAPILRKTLFYKRP